MEIKEIKEKARRSVITGDPRGYLGSCLALMLDPWNASPSSIFRSRFRAFARFLTSFEENRKITKWREARAYAVRILGACVRKTSGFVRAVHRTRKRDCRGFQLPDGGCVE